MPVFDVMAWNIQNFGWSKYNGWGDDLIAFIADVALQNSVDMLAICEIRGAAGTFIAADLVAELNNAAMGGAWAYNVSPQYGSPRWEQYILLWDTAVFTSTGFTGMFPIPGAVPADYYGFPRKTMDRPPYCGTFTMVTGGKQVRIAMYHAPNPSKLAPSIRDACNNIAVLTDLTQGDGAVVMGDFNVPFSNNVATAGSNGAYAFTAMAGAAGLYDQHLVDQQTSLIMYNSWNTINAPADAFSSPYDVFFTRRANNAVTAVAASVQQVIPQAYNGGNYEASLMDIYTTIGGNWVLAAGNHFTLRQGFMIYRGWVSDHVPIILRVNY